MKRSVLLGGILTLLLAASQNITSAQSVGSVLVPASQWMNGNGVDVKYNGPNGNAPCWGSSYTLGYYTGCEWQCGELAMRTYTTRGWYLGNFGVNYAAEIYGAAGRLGMSANPNGGGYVPVPGDMVIWAANSNGSSIAGHVAIVDRIDSGHVYVCEQNFNASGRATLNRSGSNGSSLVRSDGWGTISGCVHSPNDPFNNNSLNPHVNPALGINSDGRQEIFIVGKTGALYHNYQTTINGNWSGFISLGGNWAQNGQPEVLRNKDGRLELFIIGTNGQLNHAYEQTAGSSTSWSGFSTFSSALTQTIKIGGGTNASGALDIFVVGTDGVLYEMHQATPGGSWTSWATLGGSWSQDVDIANGNDLDGRQEVLLIGSTGNLYTIFQTAVNGGWSAITDIGGTFSQTARTALARNSDGRLEAFIIGSGGALFHAYQTTANGSWSGWSSLGGTWAADAKPVAGPDQNGAVEVMLIGNTGNFYHNYQTGGGWSGWLSLSGVFTQSIRPVLGKNQDGRLEAFMSGTGSDLLRNAETSANSSSWSTWTSLGGSWN
jgi:hypothetical protein